jgi:hypothetical protein
VHNAYMTTRAILLKTSPGVWYVRYESDLRLVGPFSTKKAAQVAVDRANGTQ